MKNNAISRFMAGIARKMAGKRDYEQVRAEYAPPPVIDETSVRVRNHNQPGAFGTYRGGRESRKARRQMARAA